MVENHTTQRKRLVKRTILVLICAMLSLTLSPCIKIAPKWLNVCTYNVYKCVDHGDYLKTGERVVDVKQIADFILEQEFDIVALQEVDVNRKYSSNTQTIEERDQPKYIAEYLTEQTGERYYYCYAPTLVCESADSTYENEYGYPTGTGLYGIALISRFPIIDCRVEYLAFYDGYNPNDSKTYVMNGYERRAMIIAKIRVGFDVVTVINTHLDLKQDAREKSFEAIKTLIEDIKTPIIFMGDLNTKSDAQTLKNLEGTFLTSVNQLNDPEFTFPSENPNRQIDWIFVSEDIVFKDFDVIETTMSDHCPISVLVDIP